MRQADIPGPQAQLRRQRLRLAMQLQPRPPPRIICANLNFHPAYIANATAQRLAHRFLPGKARRQTMGRITTISRALPS